MQTTEETTLDTGQATETEAPSYLGSATYSPDDNKLRLYPDSRLSAKDYERAKAAGFRWAPKQECFFTTWAPSAEDLLLEWCGEIDDDDKTLVERAEERAERFEEYSEKRMADATRARESVSAIADNIPFGQPILVGHHSERRARKDAERIHNGMAKAVKAFETSGYWKERAAGAIAAAKYKELPGVRSRRIKGLESELRKQQGTKADAERMAKFWRGEMKLTKNGEPWSVAIDEEHRGELFEIAGTQLGEVVGRYLVTTRDENGSASYWGAWDLLRPKEDRYRNCPDMTVAQIQERALAAAASRIRSAERWIEHYEGRLEYERGMMSESTGVAHLGERFPGLAVGWKIRARFWALPGNYGENMVCIVDRVNKDRDGRVNSVSVVGCRTPVPIEKISEALPGDEGAADKVKAASKLSPLCNYRTPGCLEMTEEEWKSNKRFSDSFTTVVVKASETAGAHRLRSRWGSYGGTYEKKPVFITDAKEKLPPPPEVSKVSTAELRPKPAPRDVEAKAPAPVARVEDPTKADFDAMKASLKAGVQVVSAPQLFPTPSELAERVVDEACIEDHHRILEPSAGTGALLDAILDAVRESSSALAAQTVAVEINGTLSAALSKRMPELSRVICADFLECVPECAEVPARGLGKFDRIVMNPPFERGADLKHMKHAFRFLKPGGRMVSICAQREETEEWANTVGDGTYEPLPDGSFTEQGTNVRTALVVIDR